MTTYTVVHTTRSHESFQFNRTILATGETLVSAMTFVQEQKEAARGKNIEVRRDFFEVWESDAWERFLEETKS